MPTFLSLLLLTLPRPSWAEGSAQLGTTQALRAGTVLGVDVLDPAVETLTWTGTGTVSVTDPTGASLGSLSSGGTLVPTVAGAYTMVVGSDQSRTAGWDVTVDRAVDAGGRLFSQDWAFNAGSFSQAAATSGSFYAKVPGGDGGSAVIELQLDGLAGYVYAVNANRTGVDGDLAGRSAPQSATTVTPEFDLYLRPPSDADYASVSPSVSGFGFEGAQESLDVFGGPLTCDAIEIGGSDGAFRFDTTAEGTWHLQCDLDGDGAFEMVGGDDLLLVGEASRGANGVRWDGTDADGSAVPSGTYDCRVRLTVGEFHYVGADIETSYPGMRLYEVDAAGTRTALPMYWNDAEVQANAQAMPNGALGLETSGESGITPALATQTPAANIDARAWGNWNARGKGNGALLDTFTWLAADTTSSVQLDALSPTADTDGDGLSDFAERCRLGTDPALADTDGDGVLDGDQYGGSTSSSASLSGLESNGRMAHALARRLVRARGQAAAQRSLPLASHAGPLSAMAPPIGPRGATPVVATPTDLPSVTNATDALGVDYLDASGDRVASLLLVETQGDAYEHTKPICDRAAGDRLVGVHPVDLGGRAAVGASLQDATGAQRDEALTLQLVEGPDGWLGEPAWLPEDLSVPARGVQAQVWAARRADRDALATALLDALGATWRDSAPPAAWFGSAAVVGGRWTARVDSRADAEMWVVVDGLHEDGTRTRFDVLAEDLAVPLAGDGPPFEELTLVLEADGVPVDRVWLSDGSWVELSDADHGGGTDTRRFETGACSDRSRLLGAESIGLALEDGAVALAGCGSLRADVDQWAGVARTVQPALDLGARPTLLAWVVSAADAQLCVESSEAGGFRCAPVAGAPEGRWVTVDLGAAAGGGPNPLGSVSLVSLQVQEAGAHAVSLSGLAFSARAPGRPDPERRVVEGAACAAVPATSGVGALLGLLALAARRRDSDTRGA